jgi:hypothetical protein
VRGDAAATLLLLALGVALTHAPRRAVGPSLLAMLAALSISILLPVTCVSPGPLFLGCWISVIATAASVHLRHGMSTRAAMSLSFNAGGWAGAVLMASGSPLDVVRVLPAVLLVLPARFIVARHGPIAVKVLASWIIAIAALSAALQALPVTPGYLPDHVE